MRVFKTFSIAGAGALLGCATSAAGQQNAPNLTAQAVLPAGAKAGSGKPPNELRHQSHSKVINGIPVPAGMLPYQVSLFRALDGHFCGGSLIDPQWVLTAAHCIMWMNVPTGFKVLAGTNNLVTGGQVLDVAQVYVHPQYDENTHTNDLALVRLFPSVIRAGAKIRTISPFAYPLAASRQLSGNAIVSGFGSTEEGGGASPILMMANVPVVSNATCNAPSSYHGEIADSMICAGGNAKDSCQGDSGGPLVMGDPQRGYALIGVVSFGEGCARPMKYGVYTRVASFADWIRYVTSQ
jgi:secreted trypsin-like serine protease